MHTRLRHARKLSRALLTAAVLGTAAGALTAGAHPATAAPGANYTLVFSDEFNGTAPDTGKWHFRTDVKRDSAQLPGNVRVGGGVMTIDLKREPVPVNGKNWSAGGLISKKKLRYGYYEARAKLPSVGGWHTAFWLMAGDGGTTYPPEARTEVDIMENDSVNTTTLHHGVHTWKGNGERGPYHPGTTYSSGPDVRQWHVYGVNWSETELKFSVDGVLKYTAPYPPSQWTHDYINVWLTSIGYGGPQGESTAQFDYVRY